MYVRKNDKGEWARWNGVNKPFQKMIAACDIHYHDGRIERDRACEPYPVEVQLSANEALGLWSDEELAQVGLACAAPFIVPEGKVAVGEARYVEKKGKIHEEFALEAPPPPPPEPTKDEKIAALLGERGLSLADLKEALNA